MYRKIIKNKFKAAIIIKKHIFLLNPTAGKVNPFVALAPKIKQAAKSKNIPFIIRQTERKGHAQELTQEYAKQGEKIRVYACGGDGTLNEVIRGAYGFDNVEVACIPCGTGNDFIRNFGTSQDFMELSDYIDGSAIDIDLISVNGDVSAAITSVGIDAEVAHGLKNYRRLPLVTGTMAYNMSIIEQVCGKLGRNFKVEIEDEIIEDNFLLIAICNGKAYGSGIIASPLSDLQDNMLEVILVKKINRLKIASVLSIYKKGEHLTKDGQVVKNLQDIIYYKTARKIKITATDGNELKLNIDGECVIADELSAEILHKAVKFVLPKSLYDVN